MPLFLSNCNNSSISTLLQNMKKKYPELFSKIRSRNQNAFSKIKKGNISKGSKPQTLIFVYQPHLININVYAKFEKIPEIS